ncbi:MAG: hypothetical protein BWY63_03414 [Chloroflexi bacterium ADurb.Bin360]|nr:MAG: hypothetical protein BWY63_03414 [Chloroflexi bacterium ADurb.Bin360]
MDSTDNQIVRLVVALLAVAGCVIWSHIWLHALETRRGRLGIMLRARAFVFLSYILNVGAMSYVCPYPHPRSNREQSYHVDMAQYHPGSRSPGARHRGLIHCLERNGESR